jgi:transcriptional regulator with XRE-family HTH domain
MSDQSQPRKSKGAFTRQFAENLARERRRVGISQEQLGFLADLHRTEIGQLERAARVPRIDTLVKLAGSLGVSPEVLLGDLTWSPEVRTGGEFT